MVHFVGVGNGAADLMTVRGTKLMKMGDIIMYPYSKMEKALVKKLPRFGVKYNIEEMTMENIISIIREAEWARMSVVILSTEVPSPECEMSKQMDELEKNGITYDFTPGVYPNRKFEFD